MLKQQDYQKFEQEASQLRKKLRSIISGMEELSLKYGLSVFIDGPAYGMGGWFEPYNPEKDSWKPDYAQMREDGKGYWQASSTSC